MLGPPTPKAKSYHRHQDLTGFHGDGSCHDFSHAVGQPGIASHDQGIGVQKAPGILERTLIKPPVVAPRHLIRHFIQEGAFDDRGLTLGEQQMSDLFGQLGPHGVGLLTGRILKRKHGDPVDLAGAEFGGEFGGEGG